MKDRYFDGPPAGPTILVVEDETLVRMAISLDLIEAGYSVIEATSAEEALDVLEAGHEVDIVFTDIRMPGEMDGLALAREIRERFPSTPVILTSGHAGGSPPDMRDQVVFLPKPYSSLVVLELVSKRIGAREERHGPGAA